MSQAKLLQNQQTSVRIFDKIVGIEFNMLLLAMMTTFGLELTVGQLTQNMKTLLVQLKLPVRKNLLTAVRHGLSLLLSNELIMRRKNGYIISENGKPLGLRTLSDFRQIAASFQN